MVQAAYSSHELSHELQLERQYRRALERQHARRDRDEVVHPWSYLARVGRGTIRLSPIEFRIFQLLSSRPYRPFSKRRIAAAISTESQPVTEESLGRYIRSLRGQLGFYRDLIQRVPYLGYRYKA